VFWDSSAIVSLIIPERRSEELCAQLVGDAPAIWWLTSLECLSAIYRRHRETPMPREILQVARERLDALTEDADTVAPTEEVRQRASRVLAVHPVRAADAIQLASALVWCKENPAGESFVCLDDRLREAARKEGFSVLPK
jgi:predicted nucleic acid-binding protein